MTIGEKVAAKMVTVEPNDLVYRLVVDGMGISYALTEMPLNTKAHHLRRVIAREIDLAMKREKAVAT